MLSEFGKEQNKRLYEYVKKLEKVIIDSEKKVIVWGLGKSGKFLTQLLREQTAVKVDFYIDGGLVIYSDTPKIYRKSILDYIDNSQYIILSTVKNISEITDYVLGYGYEMGRTFIDVYSNIGESYLDVIAMNNPGVTFYNYLKTEDERYLGTGNNEHKPSSFPNIDSVFEYIAEIQNTMDDRLRFVDLGCGNGGAIVLAKMFGINDISGIELIETLYRTAVENARILNIDCDLICGDVLSLDFDKYNFFYLYNSFQGEVLKKTIHKIEQSHKDNPRKIYLYYGNPFGHRSVVENGVFKIIKQFRVDLYDPLANLYATDTLD